MRTSTSTRHTAASFVCTARQCTQLHNNTIGRRTPARTLVSLSLRCSGRKTAAGKNPSLTARAHPGYRGRTGGQVFPHACQALTPRVTTQRLCTQVAMPATYVIPGLCGTPGRACWACAHSTHHKLHTGQQRNTLVMCNDSLQGCPATGHSKQARIGYVVGQKTEDLRLPYRFECDTTAVLQDCLCASTRAGLHAVTAAPSRHWPPKTRARNAQSQPTERAGPTPLS